MYLALLHGVRPVVKFLTERTETLRAGTNDKTWISKITIMYLLTSLREIDVSGNVEAELRIIKE